MSVAGFLWRGIFDFEQKPQKFSHFVPFWLTILRFLRLDCSTGVAVLAHGPSSLDRNVANFRP
jgi:hypothetical protein